MRPIITDRLEWRAADPARLEEFHALVSDREVVRWTATWPWPADRAFTASRCQPVPVADGLVGHVFHKGELIGAMGVYDNELGYMFKPSHWGRGYASEMARALLHRAFAIYDASTIRAGVFDGNPGSALVLEKLGFRKAGRGRMFCAAQGKTLEGQDNTLTRSDWVQANPLHLETDRLVIRALSMADTQAFHRIASQQGIARVMASLPHPLSMAQAGDWIAARQYNGRPGFFAAITGKDGTFLGLVGLGGNPVTTAYFLDPDHWGKGYATEALRAFLHFAFERFDLDRIGAQAMKSNRASRHVLKKLGFARGQEVLFHRKGQLEPDVDVAYCLTRNQIGQSR